ncbi:hypothetical protein [Achromobacter insuavis]|uniref:hypothetical protein n=1 Tax=Achromobacter insuavis TaxID=1287735 RepID=UPI0012F4D7C1|nr:hypothetical protein [Achromobacter insuavis]
MINFTYVTREVADEALNQPPRARRIMALHTLTDEEIVSWLNDNPEFWTNPGPRAAGSAAQI